MGDNLLPAPAGDVSLKRISRWKSLIDVLLENHIISQNRTRNTPILDNIRDNHKQRGLPLSEATRALDLSPMPKNAQDADSGASVTDQSAAAQSGAQQPRCCGSGGRKMTPRELAAYEVTQRHLQQPFQPIDLFREMWGDNHAEPAFWSGVPRESHIKYYAEYNANTGRKMFKHAHSRNMPVRPQNINEEEEELDSTKRNGVGPSSLQEKAGSKKIPTRDSDRHDGNQHSHSYQEGTQTPGIYLGASAVNAHSPYVLEEKILGHMPLLKSSGCGKNENSLTADHAARRATQPCEQASSIIQNHRGVAFNLSNLGRLSKDVFDEFENLSRLPPTQQETNFTSRSNDFFDKFERPSPLLGGEQQSVQQKQRREKQTFTGELTHQIPLNNEWAKQQFNCKEQRRKEKTVIGNIIREISLANQLVKEKLDEDQHHAEQHHRLLRSASEGSVAALGRANPGFKMFTQTTIDGDGGKHRHSISGELLRTTSKPVHGKNKITTETLVSELPLHGFQRPSTFAPSPHTTEYQDTGSKYANFGRIALGSFQGGAPHIPRRSSWNGEASGLLAPVNRHFEQRVASSPFIQEDHPQAVFSDDEDAAKAPSISMFRWPSAHVSMQTQIRYFKSSSEGKKGVGRQLSGTHEDGAVTPRRLISPTYEYQFDPSAIASLSPQGTGKKYLRSKRSGNRLDSIEDMGTRSPQSPTFARQMRQVSGQNVFARGRPYQQMLRRAVRPCRSSGTPPRTKSMKDAVNVYDQPGTESELSLGCIHAEDLARGKEIAQSKMRQNSIELLKKPSGNRLPFDPHDVQSVEDFIIENVAPGTETIKRANQPIDNLRSAGGTMSEEDALNFLVEDLFPVSKKPAKCKNVEVSSSNDADYRPRRKSLLRLKVVPDHKTLQSSIDWSMKIFEEPASQLTCAHSTMTSMEAETICPVDSFVSDGHSSEDAPTIVNETSGDADNDDAIVNRPLAKNRLSTPLNQPLFPDEKERNDSEVIGIMNEVDKRHPEPSMPKTKPSRVAFEMLYAINTTPRLEVEDNLPYLAPSRAVKQENADETPRHLERRNSARRRMMRSCFGFDGACDDRPEHESKMEGSERISRRSNFSGSRLLDGRLEWPAEDVDETNGSNVSPFSDDVLRLPSSTVTQTREAMKLAKQEIDRNLVQTNKTISQDLATMGTRAMETLTDETGASNKSFSRLELDSLTSQQSSRCPSSPDKKICENLLNQYDTILNPDSQLPQQSSEISHLSPMKSLQKLFNVEDKKESPALPFAHKKTWPPNPTVEEEEEPHQDILPDELILSKYVMIDVVQPGHFHRTDGEPLIPKNICKVPSAPENAGASRFTNEKAAIPKEESKIYFTIPHYGVGHQLSKVATGEKLTPVKVVPKVTFATEHAGPASHMGEEPVVPNSIPMISSAIDYGLADDLIFELAGPKNDTKSITEWSIVRIVDPTHRKVDESVKVGQEVPLDFVPEFYRKTDVAAHDPGYRQRRKDRTSGRGDFEGYMAALPSYLQNPDFPLAPMSPVDRKDAKIVPPAVQGGAGRCAHDLLTHVGGTFRHLFDEEPSMTPNPANVPLPESPGGEGFNWDDEVSDGFDDIEGLSFYIEEEEEESIAAACVKLFIEEPSDTTDPASVLFPGSPDASSFIWDDGKCNGSDNLERLNLFKVPPDSGPKMCMKLKRHFSSSWRPFPHKIVEPNLMSIPQHVRFRIYQILLPFSHKHPVLLSPVATILKFWPERSFRSPSDVLDKIGAMTLISRQFHDEIMAFYLSQLRFHITLNCRIAESLAPNIWQWLPLFASQMQYLTIEIDCTKGSGNYKDGCALRLDGVAELEKLLEKVMVPLSRRDTPMRGLTIMARRYEGNRPSGQLVPYKTILSPYQGNEIIRGKGLGKVEHPEDENWSMINGLAALADFGDEDEKLFYSLPHQEGKKENIWKNWFNLKSKPTKLTKPRNKVGKSATAHRLAQNRRPSGFKVTALRLLAGKSRMPDLNEAPFAKVEPACPAMSPQPSPGPPPGPPRQKWYAHFSPSSSRGSRRYPGWGTPSTSRTPQMWPSTARTSSADQRVFAPTCEVFKNPLPLFDGNRGSPMMWNWSTKVETAMDASVAAIKSKEKALEAHTEHEYGEEQDRRQMRIAQMQKMSNDHVMARGIKGEPRRWFMSKKAARRKRMAMRQTKHLSLHRSRRHGRHRKALRRRHGKIDFVWMDKSIRKRAMPKYKYRVFHVMEQLHRGSIPNKVTVFKNTGFFRTGKGKRHVTFLKRSRQAARAGMLMSSPYLPHDPVDNILESLAACFGPPNGPGFLFLRLSGFTKGRSEKICMQLVRKAMPMKLKGGGRNLWPKEVVGTFGKREAGVRFARFEVFEEANSFPERRGRIKKVVNKDEGKQQFNYENKELADAKQQCDDWKDLAGKEPQPDDEKELVEVVGPGVDAQANRAERFDAQRATQKKKDEVEHKHARQEFEFKMVHAKRKIMKSKAMEEKEAAKLRKDTTHISRFWKKHLDKSRILSQVGGRRRWRASGMEDDDYDDYRTFR